MIPLLSDIVERKFTASFNVSDWEVLSDDGFHPISQVHQTVPYEVYHLELSNGLVLDCADDHILIGVDCQEIFAKDSLGVVVKTEHGPAEVVSVVATGVWENMYDLTVESDAHTFFTNGILSHNTTTMGISILHYALFNERKTVAILANKAAAAREVLNRIREMYELLPHWMQQGILSWNKGDIELGNKTKIITGATSASAIRGKSVTFLYIDEAAFIPSGQADEFFASVYPTISASKTAKVCFTSTPKGLNYFYKFWTDAVEGKSEFTPFTIKWNDVPGRDEAFKQKVIETFNQEFWDQEYECQFLGSTGSLLPSSVLRQIAVKDPLVKSNKQLQVWEEPEEGRTYFMGVDVARGAGGDYSVIQVIDITEFPYRQVAVFRDNNTSHLIFPRIIAEVGRKYNDAYCLIEINDIGESVADSLYYDEEYENLMTTGALKGKISLGSWNNAKNGLRTTTATKNSGCSTLKSLIENQKLILRDMETVKELSTFISKGKTYMADAGCNDDLVMALVVFAWASSQEYFKEINSLDFKRTFQEENEAAMYEDLSPLGFMDGFHDTENDWNF